MKKKKCLTDEERAWIKELKASAPDKPTELGPIADAIKALGDELRYKKS